MNKANIWNVAKEALNVTKHPRLSGSWGASDQRRLHAENDSEKQLHNGKNN